MKSEVKKLFSTSSLGANFYIYQLPEDLGMRKILTHGIRMQKNPQMEFKSTRIIELCGSKVQLTHPHGNFTNVVTNPEIVYTKFKINC